MTKRDQGCGCTSFVMIDKFIARFTSSVCVRPVYQWADSKPL